MTKEEIYNIVKQNIMEVLFDLDESLISIEKSMRDLGANSVDRMEVVTMSLEKLNLNVPMVDFAKAKNIEELVNILLNKLEG